MRYALAGFALAAWLGNGNAAEVIRLKGVDAQTAKLKATAETQADTVPVCHGCFRRGFACCEPAVVAYGCGGCYGGMGGGYSMATPSYGFGGVEYAATPYVPAPTYSYNPPGRAYYALPAPTYTPPAPAYYAPAPTRAVVTLPRLGLSFTIGGNNGLLASRMAAANRIVPAPAPAPIEDAPMPPPTPGRPDQYRYDGGPSNPIPLPGEAPTNPTPTLNNRVKAARAKSGYLAYGERPNTIIKPDAKANTAFVKDR